MIWLSEKVEKLEQDLTKVSTYVRRNYNKNEEMLKKTDSAMKCCHEAFKMICNAQYNMSEELAEDRGNIFSPEHNVKVI